MMQFLKYPLIIIFTLVTLSGCQYTIPVNALFNSAATDEMMTTRVQRALYMNEDPVIANLRAESIDGTVVLTGHVKKIRQSDEAEALARQVRGVKEVHNKIIVRQ